MHSEQTIINTSVKHVAIRLNIQCIYTVNVHKTSTSLNLHYGNTLLRTAFIISIMAIFIRQMYQPYCNIVVSVLVLLR